MANKFEITAVKGREILDCRGYPTLQVDVWVNNDVLGRADTFPAAAPRELTKPLNFVTERIDMLALG